jgi:FkbM family methyltransferase
MINSTIRRLVRQAISARSRVSSAAGPRQIGLDEGQRHGEFGRFCAAHLQPDDTFLDIGAKIGLTSIMAARHLPEGRILAVEASGRHADALRRNIRANDVERCTIEICAVGAETGVQPFHDEPSAGFVTHARSLLSGLSTRPVPVKTIDQLGKEHRLERIDLIRLNVGGYEWEALRGAERTLERHDPIVFLEFDSWRQIALYDRNPRAFLDYLLDTFPQLYLWRAGRLVSVRELGTAGFLRENLIESRCVSDLVAARSAHRLKLEEEPGPEPGRLRRLMQRLAGGERGPGDSRA